jgi:histidinol-phosphatase (PHP family)
LRTSYHVHTCNSDGAAEMTEYVSAALDAGLDELGFSDHYALVRSGETPGWSIAPDGLPEYMEKINQVAGAAAGKLVIRAGLEVDFIPERLDDIERALAAHQLDYVIGSIHIIDDFCYDVGIECWDAMAASVKDNIVLKYWLFIRQMAESGLFDIVGHLDHVRKFGFHKPDGVSGLISEALDAIRTSGMVVELNTSGWYVPTADAYPQRWLLEECFRRDIPIVVNADAHEPANVARDIERAKSLLAQIGYRKTVRFEGRRAIQVDLG